MRNKSFEISSCYPFDVKGRSDKEKKKANKSLKRKEAIKNAEALYKVLMEYISSETFDELLTMIEGWSKGKPRKIYARRIPFNPSLRKNTRNLK